MSIAESIAHQEIMAALARIEALLQPRAKDLTELAKIDIPEPPPVIGDPTENRRRFR